jgi:hypothetical protein
MGKSPNQSKFRIVLERNTFFFHNDKFEENYEGYISSITSLLLLLKDKLEQAKTNNQRKDIVVDFIRNNPDGLNALLALLGLSRESLLRLITFIRVINNPQLRKLVNFSKWGLKEGEFRSEVREDYIVELIKKNKLVAVGLINLFFEGNTLPILRQALPLFEFKKLNFSKLDFSPQSLIDTIIRYKTKGSYAAIEENNPTGFIRKILDENGIEYNANQKLKHIRRSIDFAIPNKNEPKVIIESSYVVTTSSGMGDKAKTEIQVARDIRRYYPKTAFLGFVDGIGWYVRQGDLKRIVSAFDEVFTFRTSELKRFIEFIQKFL